MSTCSRKRWCKRRVRGGNDQVESVVFVVGRKVNVLSKVKRRQKREREKLRSKTVRRVVKMNIKVASNDKFMRCSSSN